MTSAAHAIHTAAIQTTTCLSSGQWTCVEKMFNLLKTIPSLILTILCSPQSRRNQSGMTLSTSATRGRMATLTRLHQTIDARSAGINEKAILGPAAFSHFDKRRKLSFGFKLASDFSPIFVAAYPTFVDESTQQLLGMFYGSESLSIK